MPNVKAIQQLFEMVDQSVGELVALHQTLVRCPTVNMGTEDSGNEIRVCRILQERFVNEAIPSTILESAPSRGNLVAHIGNRTSPRLLLMSHTDVVPIGDESAWSVPPFSAEIRDGKIYGRGSDDAKSLVSTGAMTLILLKRAGIPLNGELRFLAAADEEAGGKYGIAWLAQNHPDKIRSTWAINEGGGTPIQTTKGTAYLLAVGEKGRMEARFKLVGRGGHAARPWPTDNPLYKLEELIRRIHAYRAELDLRLPIFENLGEFGITDKATPETLDSLIERLRDQSLVNELKALSRLTITPTITSAGMKSNVIPAYAELVCDIRTLPHQSEAYVRAELEKIIADIPGTSLELHVTAVANASPYPTPFTEALCESLSLALGGNRIEAVPGLTVGFTDSRWVRLLGGAVYGFSPLTPDSDTSRPGVHGIDEAMEIRNLVLRTKINIAITLLALDG